MSFAFNDDQKMLAESARRFLADFYDFDKRKAILASDDGWSAAIWAQFAELGWLALPVAEEHGGLAGSTVDVAVLMEAMGAGLVVEPYVATVVLGAELVAREGTDEQKAAILPAIADGSMRLAFAHGEPKSRYALSHVETRARYVGGAWKLSGTKAVVHHAQAADRIVVSARGFGEPTEGEGIGLFLVDPNDLGVTLRPYRTNDGQRAAEVILEDATAELLGDADGEPGETLPVIEAVVDRACVLLAAEAIGCMARSVELTTEYVKTREQFGRPIGSFQVIQHRVVDMLQGKEFCRALMYRAASAMDGASERDRARAASSIKAEVGRVGKRIGQEAIQLHGGMGMTDEMAIGHYFKRMTMIDAQFGNASHHLRRFASLG